MLSPDHVRWHHAAHLSAAMRPALLDQPLLLRTPDSAAVAARTPPVVVVRAEAWLLVRAAPLLHDDVVVHNVTTVGYLHHRSRAVLPLTLLGTDSNLTIEAAVRRNTEVSARTASEECRNQKGCNKFKGHRTSRRK